RAPSYAYPLSLHDALPISGWRLEYENDAGIRFGSPVLKVERDAAVIRQLLLDALSNFREPKESLLASVLRPAVEGLQQRPDARPDRKSTRLNSSHQIISYA